MKANREDGQILILALGFLAFATVVIGATLSFAFASAATSAKLQGQRNTVYAADSATDAAIQVGRYDNTVGAYGDPRCQTTTNGAPPTKFPAAWPIVLTTQTNNNTTAKVICTTNPSDQFQSDRTVTFTTFTTFVPNISDPVVQAKVIFHDSLVTNGMPAVNVISWEYCGHGTSC